MLNPTKRTESEFMKNSLITFGVPSLLLNLSTAKPCESAAKWAKVNLNSWHTPC